MSFNNLPEEILNLIFNGFSVHDLLECQKVCRSWRKPAKLLLLTNVHIFTSHRLNQFLKSIDMEPHPSYIKAVKKISIGEDKQRSTHFDIDSIERLLFRFPFLKHVVIKDIQLMRLLLDDEFCQDLSRNCEKLQSCTIGSSVLSSERARNAYFKFMYKLRHILKFVELEVFEYGHPVEYDDPVEYIAGFSQLAEVDCLRVINLQSWVSLFEQHSGLEKLTCDLNLKKEETWNVEHSQAIENFSKLKELCLSDMSPGINSSFVDFMCRYATGFDKLSWSLWGLKHWDNNDKALFNHRLLDYICYFERFTMYLFFIFLEKLSDTVQLVLKKVFTQKTRNNTLQLVLKNLRLPHLDLSVVKNSHFEQRVSIAVYVDQLSGFDATIDTLLPMHHVDTLHFTPTQDFLPVFSTNHLVEGLPLITTTLKKLLDGIPSLTKIILDAPGLLETDDFSIQTQYPHIKHLHLLSNKDIETRGVMDKYTIMFPNLKYLKLHYFSGLWNEDSSECHINIDGWKLERLNVDISPLRLKATKKHSFFVLEVNIGQSGSRYLFKVSLDYLIISKINDTDIEDQDFIKLRISASSLEYLDLHMYRKVLRPYHSEKKYFDKCNEDIMNAKVSFV